MHSNLRVFDLTRSVPSWPLLTISSCALYLFIALYDSFLFQSLCSLDFSDVRVTLSFLGLHYERPFIKTNNNFHILYFVFRVALCLCFKTSLRAKPLLYVKEVWFAWKWNCSGTHFSLNGFVRWNSFYLVGIETQKWHIEFKTVLII